MIVRLLLLSTFLFVPHAIASEGLTLFTLDSGESSQAVNIKLEILALMTAISFLPVMLMMLTSFTRIIIVLAILRQALGLQQSPPNRVLVGIALILTIFIMRPVGDKIYKEAYLPMIRVRSS